MKHIFLIAFVTLLTLTCFSTGFAEEKQQGWEEEFVQALQQGKMPLMGAGGLPYTPAEEVVLEDAIKLAMEKDAPPCQCLIIAIDLEYNPYMVLKSLYENEGELDLDELCICATQKGVDKQIIAKAAMDAQRNGEPAFELDEITASTCLRSDEGLAYTLADDPPDAIPPPSDPSPTSRSTFQ